MTGRPNHRKGEAIRRANARPVAAARTRLERKLVAWRLAELAKYNAAPGASFQGLVDDCKNALNLVREVADTLIKQGRA